MPLSDHQAQWATRARNVSKIIQLIPSSILSFGLMMQSISISVFFLAAFAGTLCLKPRAQGCSAAAVVVRPASEWPRVMRKRKKRQLYSLRMTPNLSLFTQTAALSFSVMCVVLPSKQQRASVSSEDTESGRSSPDPQPHSRRSRHNRRSESLSSQQPPASPLDPVDT